MVEWHHQLNGHEFEQAPGDGEGQGSLACCSLWGHKELDITEPLNNNQWINWNQDLFAIIALIITCWTNYSLSTFITIFQTSLWASQVVLVIKNLPANAGDLRDASRIPGSGRSPRGGMATLSSILTWRIPWTEEPGGLQSMGSQIVGQDWATKQQ